ncbi:MAG: hypothetical protein ACFFDY_00295 [Candidatus Thorarchaeota archaeon]
MTKEQENIIQILVKSFFLRFGTIVDLDILKSEAFFVYSWLLDKNNNYYLGEDNEGIKFYVTKRLIDLVIKKFRELKKNTIISEKLEDYSINSTLINPDHELDFRIGLNKLSPNAKILIDLIFNEKSDIDKFNIQGVIRASKRAGMKRTACLKAVKEIQAFLRSL